MRQTGSIHFARYEESDRLQRVLDFMLDGLPHTGLEIIEGAKVTAVSAAADELRENGFAMECIKKLCPPTYKLFNVEHAMTLAVQLLANKEAA